MNTRFNVFQQIHKALRHALAHTLQQIQHTDAGDAAACRQLAAQVQEIILMFEGHAHTEDSMVFPLISQIAPQVTEDFEQQHAEDHRLGEELAAAVDLLEKAATTEDRATSLQALLFAFNAFTAFNLTHMNAEERVVNPLLWQQYSDAELLAKTGEIVRSLPPQKDKLYRRWMLRALSFSEIQAWYAMVRETAPAFVWEDFVEMAYQELPESQSLLLLRSKAA